jgi:type II secretion system protein G
MDQMSVQTKQNIASLKRFHHHDRERGFTLLELLVVVAIIGVLAAIAIPAYYNYVDKAKRTVAISTLDTIRKEFEFYHIDNQAYPVEPINFSTGEDGAVPTHIVFSSTFLGQINQDLTNVTYNTTGTNSYIVKAKARDKDQTQMTLTPTELY